MKTHRHSHARCTYRSLVITVGTICSSKLFRIEAASTAKRTSVGSSTRSRHREFDQPLIPDPCHTSVLRRWHFSHLISRIFSVNVLRKSTPRYKPCHDHRARCKYRVTLLFCHGKKSMQMCVHRMHPSTADKSNQMQSTSMIERVLHCRTQSRSFKERPTLYLVIQTRQGLFIYASGTDRKMPNL